MLIITDEYKSVQVRKHGSLTVVRLEALEADLLEIAIV